MRLREAEERIDDEKDVRRWTERDARRLKEKHEGKSDGK